MSEVSTYIGNRGYVIYKECMELEDQRFVREQLTVKPIIPKSPIQPPSFPIYREGPNKLYLPKYFGIEHFGEPEELRLNNGEDINIEFNGKLRDYQMPIIDAYMKSTQNNYGGGGLLDIPCGFGKCHGKNTPILMYDGTIKMVQDIVVGDLLMGDDSTPRKVLSLARGREKLFTIKQNKGENYVVNESHILSLKHTANVGKFVKDEVVDIKLSDYIRIAKRLDYENTPLLGYKVPVEFSEKHVTIDPYLIGLWISYSYNTELINSNLFIEDDKIRIPHNYKCNSLLNRYKLMAGLLDGYGEYNKYNKNFTIYESNKELKDDIVYLARSIGLNVNVHNKKKSDMLKEKHCVINIYGNILSELPLLKYKNLNFSYYNDNLNTQIKVIYNGVGNYYGFTLDGNHRYLLGDFTVTHNTAMGLYIASKLSKKTLVIVHKDFLLKQWIERISEFLPTARVGKIQGQIIDIEDKDIVIGMLQSLSMKEYPENMFNSFGLTIVDECHHISSEVFSRSLSKIITKYTLGLSATMERKDGLTHVFKMFLGDIVYKVEREAEENVMVKCIEYISNDTDFEEVTYDYRGNPQYSTMITKLCEYNDRSEFILKVLINELREKKDQQIMILGQNKSILKYLYDAIEYRNIATVGYYVGGMKEEALKQSEMKQVVVATYAMAAEGLDIKTLSTLMLVTPRTDIIQAVGRILRVKHERPLVIDIVDTHDLFKNQFKKRLTFYRKNKYNILETNSENYDKNIWKNISKTRRTNKSNNINKFIDKEPRKCLVKIK